MKIGKNISRISTARLLGRCQKNELKSMEVTMFIVCWKLLSSAM
jgi:hypothetical protein